MINQELFNFRDVKLPHSASASSLSGQVSKMDSKRTSESSSYSEDSDGESSTDTSLCDDDIAGCSASSVEASPLKKRLMSEVPEDQHSHRHKKSDEPKKSKKERPDVLFTLSDINESHIDYLDLPSPPCGITSTSQLSPIPDISKYLIGTAISPIKTPSSKFEFVDYVEDFSETLEAEIRAEPKYEVNEDGVTNEFFERVTSTDRINEIRVGEMLLSNPSASFNYNLSTSSNDEDEVKPPYSPIKPPLPIVSSAPSLTPLCTDLSSISPDLQQPKPIHQNVCDNNDFYNSTKGFKCKSYSMDGSYAEEEKEVSPINRSSSDGTITNTDERSEEMKKIIEENLKILGKIAKSNSQIHEETTEEIVMEEIDRIDSPSRSSDKQEGLKSSIESDDWIDPNVYEHPIAHSPPRQSLDGFSSEKINRKYTRSFSISDERSDAGFLNTYETTESSQRKLSAKVDSRSSSIENDMNTSYSDQHSLNIDRCSEFTKSPQRSFESSKSRTPEIMSPTTGRKSYESEVVAKDFVDSVIKEIHKPQKSTLDKEKLVDSSGFDHDDTLSQMSDSERALHNLNYQLERCKSTDSNENFEKEIESHKIKTKQEVKKPADKHEDTKPIIQISYDESDEIIKVDDEQSEIKDIDLKTLNNDDAVHENHPITKAKEIESKEEPKKSPEPPEDKIAFKTDSELIIEKLNKQLEKCTGIKLPQTEESVSKTKDAIIKEEEKKSDEISKIGVEKPKKTTEVEMEKPDDITKVEEDKGEDIVTKKEVEKIEKVTEIEVEKPETTEKIVRNETIVNEEKPIEIKEKIKPEEIVSEVKSQIPKPSEPTESKEDKLITESKEDKLITESKEDKLITESKEEKLITERKEDKLITEKRKNKPKEKSEAELIIEKLNSERYLAPKKKVEKLSSPTKAAADLPTDKTENYKENAVEAKTIPAKSESDKILQKLNSHLDRFTNDEGQKQKSDKAESVINDKTSGDSQKRIERTENLSESDRILEKLNVHLKEKVIIPSKKEVHLEKDQQKEESSTTKHTEIKIETEKEKIKEPVNKTEPSDVTNVENDKFEDKKEIRNEKLLKMEQMAEQIPDKMSESIQSVEEMSESDKILEKLNMQLEKCTESKKHERTKSETYSKSNELSEVALKKDRSLGKIYESQVLNTPPISDEPKLRRNQSDVILEKLNAQLSKCDEDNDKPYRRSRNDDTTKDKPYRKPDRRSLIDLERLLDESDSDDTSKSYSRERKNSPASRLTDDSKHKKESYTNALFDLLGADNKSEVKIKEYYADTNVLVPSRNNSRCSSPATITETLSSIQHTIKSLDTVCQRKMDAKKLSKAMENIEKICEADDWKSYKIKKSCSPTFKIDNMDDRGGTSRSTDKDYLNLDTVRSPRERSRDRSPRRKRYDDEELYKRPSREPSPRISISTVDDRFRDNGLRESRYSMGSNSSISNLEFSRNSKSPTSPSRFSDKLEIRHTSVTSTLYDRYQYTKKEQYIDRSPTSPILSRNYAYSPKSPTKSPVKSPSFNTSINYLKSPATPEIRSSKSAESSPSRYDYLRDRESPVGSYSNISKASDEDLYSNYSNRFKYDSKKYNHKSDADKDRWNYDDRNKKY